ncbi:hypothetical protein KEM52_002954, partial [Ascosphaera acerosa]
TDLNLHPCVQLERLALLDCITYEGHRRTPPLLPESLQHLSLSHTTARHPMPGWQPRALRSLVCTSADTTGSGVFPFVFSPAGAHGLVHLDLQNIKDPDAYPSFVDALARDQLRHVRHLNLAQIPEVRDETMKLLTRHMPELEYLNISGTAVTESAIRWLATAASAASAASAAAAGSSDNAAPAAATATGVPPSPSPFPLKQLVCHGLYVSRDYQGAIALARACGISVPVVKSQIPPAGVLGRVLALGGTAGAGAAVVEAATVAAAASPARLRLLPSLVRGGVSGGARRFGMGTRYGDMDPVPLPTAEPALLVAGADEAERDGLCRVRRRDNGAGTGTGVRVSGRTGARTGPGE